MISLLKVGLVGQFLVLGPSEVPSQKVFLVFFAELIEKKSYDKHIIIFALPSTNKQRESTIQLQQLELGLEVETKSSYRSTSV
jgi:hypothetical protein